MLKVSAQLPFYISRPYEQEQQEFDLKTRGMTVPAEENLKRISAPRRRIK